MKLESINLTNTSNGNTFYVNGAFLEKNRGIVNDRYYNNYKNKKEQVTIINIEKIIEFNNFLKKNIEPKNFRRNLIISGLDLSKMIGKKIKIGNVTLKIHEICQPCNYLQKKLKIPNLVKLLLNKSGVRAEILTSGYVNVNDKISVVK